MKKRKIIKFWFWSMHNFTDIACKLEELTSTKPKHFRFIYDGSSDYIIAYSNSRFSYEEALMAYSRNKDNGLSYKELLEIQSN